MWNACVQCREVVAIKMPGRRKIIKVENTCWELSIIQKQFTPVLQKMALQYCL